MPQLTLRLAILSLLATSAVGFIPTSQGGCVPSFAYRSAVARQGTATVAPPPLVERRRGVVPTEELGRDRLAAPGDGGGDFDSPERRRLLKDAERVAGMNRKYRTRTAMEDHVEGRGFLEVFSRPEFSDKHCVGRLREGMVVTSVGPNTRDKDGNEWVLHDHGGYSMKRSPSTPWNIWLLPLDHCDARNGCSIE